MSFPLGLGVCLSLTLKMDATEHRTPYHCQQTCHACFSRQQRVMHLTPEMSVRNINSLSCHLLGAFSMSLPLVSLIMMKHGSILQSQQMVWAYSFMHQNAKKGTLHMSHMSCFNNCCQAWCSSTTSKC